MAVAVVLAGCGGDDDDDTTGPSGNAALSVSTGDGSLNSSAATALISNGLLSIGAAGTSGGVTRSVGIAIQSATTGTFTVGALNGAVVTYTEVVTGSSSGKSWLAAAGSGSGTVTITELTATRVVGTFTATLPPVESTGATSTKTLTNGSFNIAITSSN
jgi:hypothetical protein